MFRLHVCTPGECLRMSDEGIRSTGAVVMDSCEQPWGCREWNPCPLQEQLESLINKPSLQPHPRDKVSFLFIAE